MYLRIVKNYYDKLYSVIINEKYIFLLIKLMENCSFVMLHLGAIWVKNRRKKRRKIGVLIGGFAFFERKKSI